MSLILAFAGFGLTFAGLLLQEYVLGMLVPVTAINIIAATLDRRKGAKERTTIREALRRR